MTIDIDQLRGLIAKATPGPWSIGKPYMDDEGYREFPLFASVNGKTVCPIAVCLPFPHVGGMQETHANPATTRRVYDRRRVVKIKSSA